MLRETHFFEMSSFDYLQFSILVTKENSRVLYFQSELS